MPSTAFCTYIDLCYAGLQATEDWEFVTAGVVSVINMTVFPPDDSKNVSAGTLATFNFSEFVFKGTGSITITNETDGTVITLPVESPLVDLRNDTVTLRVELQPLAAYSIVVPPSTFRSFAQVPIEGVLTDQDWNFHVSDAAVIYISAKDQLRRVVMDGSEQSVVAYAGYDMPAVVDRVVLPVFPGESLLAVQVAADPSPSGTGGLLLGIDLASHKAQTGQNVFYASVNSEGRVEVHGTARSPGDGDPSGPWDSDNSYDVSGPELWVNPQDSDCDTLPDVSAQVRFERAPPSQARLWQALEADWIWPGGCRGPGLSGFSEGYFRFRFSVGLVLPFATLVPADDEIGVVPGLVTISLNFNEFMEEGVCTVTLDNDSDETRHLIDVSVATNDVQISGRRVDITVPPLLSGKAYHVTVPSTCFHAFSDLDFPGLHGDSGCSGTPQLMCCCSVLTR